MSNNFSIPNRFVPGETARANDVNANFDAIEMEFNSNVLNRIDELDNSVVDLSSDKADINGNQSIQFNVANPTAPTNAVNLQTLEKYMGNFMYYIYGLELSIYDDAIKHTLVVSSGTCYDGTKTIQMELLEDTQLTIDTSNNTTYYIYICADESGTNCVLGYSTLSNGQGIIDDSQQSVSKEYSRLLGSCTTNGSGEITSTNSMSNTAQEDSSMAFTSCNVEIPKGENIDLTEPPYNIPNDGKLYIIWVHNHLYGIGSGASCTVSTDIFPSTTITRCDSDANRNSHSINLVAIPLGNGRTITVTKKCTLKGFMKV